MQNINTVTVKTYYFLYLTIVDDKINILFNKYNEQIFLFISSQFFTFAVYSDKYTYYYTKSINLHLKCYVPVYVVVSMVVREKKISVHINILKLKL